MFPDALLSILTTLIVFLITISILVVFHEMGHYLVARLCGVKVLRFSFGFGKVLFSRRFGKDQTEWALSAIPLGGYVKMLGEQPGEAPQAEAHRAFNRPTIGRSLIVVAGPLANLLLAFVLFWALFIYGTQEMRPLVGQPTAGTPAAQAGFADGDLVTAINDQPVAGWQDLRWQLLKQAVDNTNITVRVVTADGEQKTRHLDLESIHASRWEISSFENLGLSMQDPHIPPILGEILPGGPGQKAGLQPGDIVVAVDGTPITRWREFTDRIKENPGTTLELSIKRGDRELTLPLTPQGKTVKDKTVGEARIMLNDSVREKLLVTVQYEPWTAFRKAAAETWDKTVFTVVMLGKMATGSATLKNISGPITIADLAGQSVELGLDYYLNLLAIISIGLGVINLLPIPILDGGHLLYHAIEFIKRSPVSEKAQIIGQKIGLVFLVALIFLAFYNDIFRHGH